MGLNAEKQLYDRFRPVALIQARYQATSLKQKQTPLERGLYGCSSVMKIFEDRALRHRSNEKNKNNWERTTVLVAPKP
jgi:hypothetical protein